MNGQVHIEPVTGRYMRLPIDGQMYRVYWEEAGSGIPLVCLHTAGADGRQYRELLNDEQITANFRVIVFDMPWHGKSSPPAGFQQHTYELTTEGYVNQILAICDALALEQPVVMGCSIGGRVVLQLALHHPERFSALIGLQSSAHVEPYYDTSWLHRSDVHGGEICGAIAYGLMAPMSPDDHRYETVWHYQQGGPGVFKGDLYFYKIDGDFREQLSGIDTSKCPLYLLTGGYDYSCTPDDTRQLASQLGVDMIEMENLGHFPMSENPQLFRQYLLPVLEEIRSKC